MNEEDNSKPDKDKLRDGRHRVTNEYRNYDSNSRRNEPAHEIIVITTYTTSEGSGEPAHARSLTRAFAVHAHEV